MKTIGRHVIVEYYGCTPTTLDDPDEVHTLLAAAAHAIGATPVARAFHRFDPSGVSGTLVIAESHLSIHTWPEAGYAAVDIYTCGDLDPWRGLESLGRGLGADQVRVQEIVRGLPRDLAAHPDLRPQDVRVLVDMTDAIPLTDLSQRDGHEPTRAADPLNSTPQTREPAPREGS